MLSGRCSVRGRLRGLKMAEEIDELRAVLERDPTDEAAYVELCQIAEEENNYEYLAELVAFRAQVLEDAPEAAALYLRAGDIYINNIGDLPRGVEVLLKGFECDPTHGVLGERIAGIYRDAEDWEAALALKVFVSIRSAPASR